MICKDDDDVPMVMPAHITSFHVYIHIRYACIYIHTHPPCFDCIEKSDISETPTPYSTGKVKEFSHTEGEKRTPESDKGHHF